MSMPSTPGDTPAPKLLVVDDEPEVRAAVEDGLAVEGYEVRGAADGLAALSEVATWQPDALVLDVMMPVLDGLAVCRRLRALDDRTPILVLTALDSVSERVDGLDAGADDYLVKPFALDELVARVRALLRRASAARRGRHPALLRRPGRRPADPHRPPGGPARWSSAAPNGRCWSCCCCTPGR